jgi:hypothetical protein
MDSRIKQETGFPCIAFLVDDPLKSK